jgi:hypothetical protein
MGFASDAGVLIAVRIVLFVVPLTSAVTGRSPAPTDTVQQINRCLTAVRVAVSRRHTLEPEVLTLRQPAICADRGR